MPVNVDISFANKRRNPAARIFFVFLEQGHNDLFQRLVGFDGVPGKVKSHGGHDEHGQKKQAKEAPGQVTGHLGSPVATPHATEAGCATADVISLLFHLRGRRFGLLRHSRQSPSVERRTMISVVMEKRR
jgi:hypothetical protein